MNDQPEKPKMKRGRKAGVKKVAYTTKQYSFRFKTTDDEQPYIDKLDKWLEDRDETMFKSERMIQIMRVLMDNYEGEMPIEGELQLAQLINRRFDNLERTIKQRLDKVMRSIIENPGVMQQMNDVSQRVQNGETIDAGFIDNILEDFGRE